MTPQKQPIIAGRPGVVGGRPDTASREGRRPGPAATGSSPHLWAVEVLQALSDLDRVERAALRLIYCRQLSQAQVARELALPESTIRRRVARGLHQMAAHLAEGGQAPTR